jgi:hypothetical protein
MKTQIQKQENVSHTIQTKTKAANQASIAQVLQKYKDKTVQREALPEEDELLQGKFETAQREELDDEDELLQGKFETAQREELDDEEPLQGKFANGKTVQRETSPNNTGLPDNLKTGIENLSGYSMDDVRVHYNSPKPAQLQALAYTQGTDIHVAPGQEKHLPHEAWHVVQQKQGRVQPTMQLQGVNVNDNEGLEHEADVMGEKIFYINNNTKTIKKNKLIQFVIQKKDEFFPNAKEPHIHIHDGGITFTNIGHSHKYIVRGEQIHLSTIKTVIDDMSRLEHPNAPKIIDWLQEKYPNVNDVEDSDIEELKEFLKEIGELIIDHQTIEYTTDKDTILGYADEIRAAHFEWKDFIESESYTPYYEKEIKKNPYF